MIARMYQPAAVEELRIAHTPLHADPAIWESTMCLTGNGLYSLVCTAT